MYERHEIIGGVYVCAYCGAEVTHAWLDEEDEGAPILCDADYKSYVGLIPLVCLPRVAWQAMPYRVVEYYDDDQDRIALVLERWDGNDRLGLDRWQTVAAPDRYDAAGAAMAARDWHDAFWALGTPLWVPLEEAQRRQEAEQERQRRWDERYSEPW